MRSFCLGPSLTAVGIDIGIRVIARLGAIRIRFEARAELVVVIAVHIFMIDSFV